MLMAAPNELFHDDRSLYRSFGLQAAICLAIGTLLPATTYFGAETALFAYGPVRNSVLGTAIAAILGILLARRVNIYPGVKQFGSVLPAFFLSFGLVAMGILALRASYSIPVFGVNFAISISSYLIIMVLATRSDQNIFYTVPGGRITRLRDVGIQTRRLAEPILPKHRGAILVADLHRDHPPEWVRLLANAALQGVPVFHFKQVYEAATGKVQVEHLSENSFGSLLPSMSFMRIKRMADILLSLILIPVLFVPLCCVAVLVMLDSPGGAFFRQQRTGYRGEPFYVLKFRTMRKDTAKLDEAARRNSAMTGDNDPRITRFGRFLRQTRIDELPQMWNILLGHMSWIGPRPEALELARWYQEEIPFYDYRHIVRPGITGWAQVNQGHVTDLADVDQKLQYDFYYIKNFSYWLDFVILARTAKVVITGNGAK